MTSPNPYSVPLDELDQVHVDVEQQVKTQSAGGPPADAGPWGGALLPAHGAGGGGGGDVAGDGD